MGESADLPKGSVVQVCSVQISIGDSVEVDIPDEVRQLIEEFEVPTELPPPRSCDHTIPLVKAAAPVNIRSYRFAPIIKDEIEKQVKKMLKNDLIQKFQSFFIFSPIG